MFRDIINRYKTKFKVTFPSKGRYNDEGEYIEGYGIEREMEGAIFARSESKNIRNEGNYNVQDKVLYILREIPLNSIVRHKGKTYSIVEASDTIEFTGFYKYILRYNSNFSKEGYYDRY